MKKKWRPHHQITVITNKKNSKNYEDKSNQECSRHEK